MSGLLSISKIQDCKDECTVCRLYDNYKTLYLKPASRRLVTTLLEKQHSVCHSTYSAIKYCCLRLQIMIVPVISRKDRQSGAGPGDGDDGI